MPPNGWASAARDRARCSAGQWLLILRCFAGRLHAMLERGMIAHEEISSPFKKTTQRPSIHSDAPIAEYVSPLSGRKDPNTTANIGDTQPLAISSESSDDVPLKRKRTLKKRK